MQKKNRTLSDKKKQKKHWNISDKREIVDNK